MLLQIGVYLVSAFSFYKLAKVRCVDNAWFSFIPFLSLFIQGNIGDTLKYNNPAVSRYLGGVPLAYLLPVLSIVSGFTWMVPLLGGLVSDLLTLIIYLLQLVIYYMVFDQYAGRDKVLLYTLLSIIPLVGPCLILYCLRDYQA